MKPRALLLMGVLLATLFATAHAADGRFSQTITTSNFVEAGLGKLSSDQIAALDALVRRDQAAVMSLRRAEKEKNTRFTQRLVDTERTAAGLTLLTEAELARLDALVDRPADTATDAKLLEKRPYVSAIPRLREVDRKTGPEVHGSISFSYGWGSGGYSEKTGGINLTYDDPDHGLSVAVGYSETSIKGGPRWREESAGISWQRSP